MFILHQNGVVVSDTFRITLMTMLLSREVGNAWSGRASHDVADIRSPSIRKEV
jgi:hypothetical protein